MPKKILSPNYTEVPWQIVVKEICAQNHLNCWTHDATLYAADKRNLATKAIDYYRSVFDRE